MEASHGLVDSAPPQQQQPESRRRTLKRRLCQAVTRSGCKDTETTTTTTDSSAYASGSSASSASSSYASSQEEEGREKSKEVEEHDSYHGSPDGEEVNSPSRLSPPRMSLWRRRLSIDSMESDKASRASSIKRKGVTYTRDGAVVSCRFCQILHDRREVFLYEDESIVVFRPLAPVVDSHILVVPRCHIRNVNKLTQDHSALLTRMKEVAKAVLNEQGPSSKNSPRGALERGHKFAFHTPPFNSIDHVHMHAFWTNEQSFGCLGAIKYRTQTWWCRSFDQIMARLETHSPTTTTKTLTHDSEEPTWTAATVEGSM